MRYIGTLSGEFAHLLPVRQRRSDTADPRPFGGALVPAHRGADLSRFFVTMRQQRGDLVAEDRVLHEVQSRGDERARLGVKVLLQFG